MTGTIYKNIKIDRLNFFALFAVVLLTVLYLFMANDVATANYQASVLQKRVDAIIMDVRNLNLELTDKRSVSFLKKSAQDLNLVINENIQYIKIAGPVAKNP